MANTKIIKQKIKAISNIKKITKTMEMVSFAKMRKSAAEVTGMAEYARGVKSVLALLGNSAVEENALSQGVKGAVDKDLVLIFASNKGLCGSFNTNLYKQLKRELEKNPSIKDVICFGKFAEKIARRLGLNIILSYLEIDKVDSVAKISKIETLVRGEFLNKKYTRVHALYTNFVKMGVFEPTVAQVYPLQSIAKAEEVISGNVNFQTDTKEEMKKENQQYTFEPSVQEVVSNLIPKLVKMLIFSFLLESRASEHSSRSFAMKRANESAGEMLGDLKLLYNKVRQDSITQEIAEISAGANAA
jgi:F-type H+-transporting ATPase subunit gamma